MVGLSFVTCLDVLPLPSNKYKAHGKSVWSVVGCYIRIPISIGVTENGHRSISGQGIRIRYCPGVS